MIRMKGWGPDTSISTRESVLAELRREHRLSSGQTSRGPVSPPGSQTSRSADTSPGSNRLVLATCDRVELYEGSGAAEPETATHLFALAAGIKSPLLGENAILGQIKRSYETWRLGFGSDPANPSTGRQANPGMHLLFQSALRCGKLVRTRTGLSRGAMGHGQAALELLKTLGGSSGRKVVCVGINKFMEEIIHGLGRSGWGDLCLVNRDQEKAQIAAGQAVCRHRGFGDLAEEIASCDILFSATSAPHQIIHAPQHRFDKPAILFDLAVPRDIDPAFADQPGIRLFNIQDLEARMAGNRDARHALLPQARALVDQEVTAYLEKAHRRFGDLQESARPAHFQAASTLQHRGPAGSRFGHRQDHRLPSGNHHQQFLCVDSSLGSRGIFRAPLGNVRPETGVRHLP